MRTVSPEQTSARTVGHHGNRYVMSDYLGRHDAETEGPQAYLVRQQSAELRAHFHEVDQFQVVYDGVGTLGRDRACRGVLHYTDGFTSYGPIRTDPEVGLAYFTLRPSHVTGINYMPEEREKRAAAGGGGEHFTCRLPDEPAAQPAELARTGRGAAAYGCRLRGGAALATPPEVAAREGYAVVLTGILDAGGCELPAGSLVHFAPADPLTELTARTDADVAVLVFAPAA